MSEDAVVWEVAASNRSGYDYDANEIFITNRSYETVFDSEILIEGLVNGSGGTIALYVNGSKADSKSVSDRETFSFTSNINQGRNDVYLLFTANNGTQTKKAFNYVYATDFDAIVDASFTGTDGTAFEKVASSGSPTAGEFKIEYTTNKTTITFATEDKGKDVAISMMTETKTISYMQA